MSATLIEQIFGVIAHCNGSGLDFRIEADAGDGLDLRVIRGEETSAHICTIEWRVLSETRSELAINPRLIGSERMGYVATRLVLALPLLRAYHDYGAPVRGRVALHLEDYSEGCGLSFCANGDEATLIPDTDFMASGGYRGFREELDRSVQPWPRRDRRAVWRGSTTGLVWKVPSWRELPRVKLCEITQSHPELFDVGISSVVQIETHKAEIEAAGYMADPIPAVRWADYAYQIDVDGNANAWAGFFQRLLSGSPVLKVASPFGFRQWFYHRLRPWVHYVPIAADMHDLLEKLEWLNNHPVVARMIGEQGRSLAVAIDYPGEMRKAVLATAAAIRDQA